jgi:hypothetical protein
MTKRQSIKLSMRRMWRAADLWHGAEAAAGDGQNATAARKYRAAAKLYRLLPGTESMADECQFRAGRYQAHADHDRYIRQLAR